MKKPTNLFVQGMHSFSMLLVVGIAWWTTSWLLPFSTEWNSAIAFALGIVLANVAKRIPALKSVLRIAGYTILPLLILFVALTPIALLNAALRWSDGLPREGQVLVLVVLFAGLAALLWTLYEPRLRPRLVGYMASLGLPVPLVYLAVLVLCAAALFGHVTYLALASSLTAARPVTPGLLQDFYLWHILDSVPGLEATKTLRWSEPATYESSAVGATVLAFKVLVLLPVFSVMAVYFKARFDPEPARRRRPERPRTGRTIGVRVAGRQRPDFRTQTTPGAQQIAALRLARPLRYPRA